MVGDFTILFLVFFPMFGAIISYMVGKKNKTARDFTANLIVLIEFVAMLTLCKDVAFDNQTLYFNWANFSGNGLTFTVDGFRLIYGVMVTFIWLLTTIFSREYFKTYKNRNRYYFFNLLTLGATMGVFLSADLFTTFIFFELMYLTSYVWVIHDEKHKALLAGQTYLAMSIIGGLIMLMGIFLLYDTIGTLQISQLLESASAIQDKTTLYIAGGCLFVGFGAKAGAFPFHVWLPAAYTLAPAPASAILSSVLTKTGIFGILIVSCQLLYGQSSWGNFVLVIGVITMVLGAILALLSVNLKRTLACSSMSQIGFILTGIGIQVLLASENALAVHGTFLHTINHSLIKLVLFTVSGVVFMNIHMLELDKIQGFGRKKPVLHFAFLMGGLGIAGIPLFNGYVSKTLLHESILEYIAGLEQGIFTNNMFPPYMIKGVESLFILSGAITLAYILKLYICLFIRKNNDAVAQSKFDDMSKTYINWESRIVLIVSACILPVMGLFPTQIMNPLAGLAQGFMNGTTPAHAVDYFNGHNLEGAFLTIGIGIVLYIVIVRICLMKKDGNKKLYHFNALPKWLSIEDVVYRPLFATLIPTILQFIARVADSVVDFIVILLRKTVYKDQKLPRKLLEGTTFTHLVGHIMDYIRDVKNKVLKTTSPDKTSYVHRLAVLREEIAESNVIITGSLSFGLFMFCLGLSLTIIYLLVV